MSKLYELLQDQMDPDGAVMPRNGAVAMDGASNARPFAMNPVAGARDPVRRLRQLLEAERETAPIVGNIIAADSAEQVFGIALSRLGIKTDGVHSSGFGAIFKAARDRQRAGGPLTAMDSAAAASFAQRFPDVARGL
jgi:hypothetical protein